MTASIEDRDDKLLQAYCDGALDPVSAANFERSLAADRSLQQRRDQIIALRGALQSLPQGDLPPRLLARVTSALDSEHSRQGSWSWQALAASALIGAILASSIMLGSGRYSERQDVARQVVASHIRSLLAPQPFDIASSDRHTVKPWFTTRLPESPQVVDLAPQGFALVGGRVDVIGRDPVATIVYRHAAHVVSLTTLRAGQSVPGEALAGYNVRSWHNGDFTYVVVSDIPSDDLAAFERAFRAASSQ